MWEGSVQSAVCGASPGQLGLREVEVAECEPWSKPGAFLYGL